MMMRRLELRVAEVPIGLRPRYDLSPAVPVWEEEPHITLADLPKDTRAFLVCVRDGSMQHYWEPLPDGEEWSAAQALYWGVTKALFDGRQWRLCICYGRLGKQTASEFGLSLAFAVPVADEEGQADHEPLEYWWCPKSSLRQRLPEFWRSVGYVLRPSAARRVRQILMTRDSTAALDALLDDSRFIYLDWGDGSEMLILSRVIRLADVLRACRSRPVDRAFRRLQAAADRRKSWQSLPPDIEREYLADLRHLSQHGMQEIVVRAGTARGHCTKVVCRDQISACQS